MASRRKVELTFEVKTKGTSAVLNDLKKQEGAVGRIAGEVDAFAKRGGLAAMAAGSEAITEAQTRIAQIGRELVTVQEEIDGYNVLMAQAERGSDVWLDTRDRLVDLESRSASLRKELARIPVDLREETTRAVGFLGDIDTGLNQISSTMTGLGGIVERTGGISGAGGGQGVQLSGGFFQGAAAVPAQIAEVFALAEQIPRMRAAFGVLAQRMREADGITRGHAATIQYLKDNEQALRIARTRGDKATEQRILQQAQAQGELARSQGTVRGGLKGMITQFAAAGVAMGSFMAITQSLQVAMKETIKNVQAGLDSLPQVAVSAMNPFETAVNATSEDIAALRQQYLLQERAIDANIDKLDTAIESYKDADAALEFVGRKVYELGDFIGIVENPIERVEDALDETQKDAKVLATNMERLDSEFVRAIVSANDLVAQLAKEREQRVQFAHDVENATSQEIEQRQAALDSQTAAINASIERLEEEVRVRGNVNDLATQALRNEIDRLGVARDELNAQAAVLDKLEPLVAERERETKALEDAKTAMNDYNAAVEATKATTEQLADAQQALEDFYAERVKQEQRDGEVAALEQKIAAAKKQEQEQAHQQQLTDIQAAAQDKRLDLETKYSDALKAAQAKLETTRAALDKALIQDGVKAAQTYQKELQALQTTYHKESKTLEADYIQDRLDILSDLNKSLLDAARANDVNAFIAAQEAAKDKLGQLKQSRDKERGELDTQFKEETEARQAAYFEETKQRQVAYNERLDQLNEQFKTEKQTRQAEYTKAQAQLEQATQERLAAVKAAHEQEKKESERLEQELANLREQWRREDEAQRVLAERDGLHKQVEQLKEHQNEQLVLMSRYYTNARGLLIQWGGDMNKFMADMASQASAVSGSYSRYGSSYSQVASGARNALKRLKGRFGFGFSNADGGIYDNPTLGMLGDKVGYGDVVIPFRQSEGIERALSRYAGRAGGRSLTVNIPGMMVGENVTRSELDQLQRTLVSALSEAIEVLG